MVVGKADHVTYNKPLAVPSPPAPSNINENKLSITAGAI
jgi:hypothetical protein